MFLIRFLCPNDTAFDQESQTCADWYDVDCEAATLYYASDNFDLYRIGSGLESLHYDHLRSDAEPQDNLQRSETSDAVRSSANTVNRVSSSNYNNREVLRSSSSGNFYNRNNKEDDYENEKSYKEEQDTKKKGGIRKTSRKQPYTGNGSSNYSPTTTTAAPVSNRNTYNGNYYNNYNQRSTTYAPSTTTTSAPVSNHNTYNGNYYNNYNQRSTTYASSTTVQPQREENYNRNQNTQRYNAPSSTYRPSTTYQDTYSNYQSPSTTVRTTPNNIYTNFYNIYTSNQQNHNQQNTGSSVQATTLKPSSYNPKISQQIYQFAQSTTVQPSTNYQTSDYTNYQQRNYNNIQRGSSASVAHQSTTSAPTVYNHNYNNNNGQYRPATSTSQNIPQTTAKYYASNYASNSYAPTTYSPATKKYVNTDNTVAQTALRNNDNGQYYDKTSQAIKSSTQYYDSTKPPKKATQYNNYDNASSGKSYYIETSTGSFNIARSSVGIGFSPASINHLAESPRTTTPVPR